MADNPTGAEGWYDPSQWTDPVARLNFTTDGPVEVSFVVVAGDEAELYLTRPTLRQRIGALVRRVLRRKADV